MKYLPIILLLCLNGIASAAMQDRASISQSAREFIAQQTATLPGKYAIQVDEIDARLSFAACDHLQAFLPAGSRLLGRTSVGVRCEHPTQWSVLMPAQIKVTLNLLVSAHQLPPGHVLSGDDLVAQSMETTQSSGYTDIRQISGKVLRFGIAAGQMLREDMLREPYVVTQGQSVPILVSGTGFSLRNEGIALNNAAVGQAVQIRIGTKRIITATARADGTVLLNQ